VLDAVDALRQRRARAAAEDERKLLARRPRGVALGNFEELDLECRLRLGRDPADVELSGSIIHRTRGDRQCA